MDEEGGVSFNRLSQYIWEPGNEGEVRLTLFGSNTSADLSTPGGFIAYALPYLYIAGFMILFIMIVWGSLEVMLGANDPKSAESGKKRITSAIIGFLILFASYWIGQIIQIIFGIDIRLAR